MMCVGFPAHFRHFEKTVLVCSLEVFDLSGRRIKTLISADELQASIHAFNWEGVTTTVCACQIFKISV